MANTAAVSGFPGLPRAYQILDVLTGFAHRHGKHYCFPSQDTICRVYEARFGIPLSRRHLNRILSQLQDAEMIRRTRRHRKKPRGGILFSSTLYHFSRAAFATARRTLTNLGHLLGRSRVTRKAQQGDRSHESSLPRRGSGAPTPAGPGRSPPNGRPSGAQEPAGSMQAALQALRAGLSSARRP